jgi:hypothetical protein
MEVQMVKFLSALLLGAALMMVPAEAQAQRRGGSWGRPQFSRPFPAQQFRFNSQFRRFDRDDFRFRRFDRDDFRFRRFDRDDFRFRRPFGFGFGYPYSYGYYPYSYSYPYYGGYQFSYPYYGGYQYYSYPQYYGGYQYYSYPQYYYYRRW